MDKEVRDIERLEQIEAVPFKTRLTLYERAGRLKECIEKASDAELMDLFREWGQEFTTDSNISPSLFFPNDQFDQYRFEIWVYVQDRFPLLLRGDSDEELFKFIPTEPRAQIKEVNVRRANPRLINSFDHLLDRCCIENNYSIRTDLLSTLGTDRTVLLSTLKTDRIESLSFNKLNENLSLNDLQKINPNKTPAS